MVNTVQGDRPNALSSSASANPPANSTTETARLNPHNPPRTAELFDYHGAPFVGVEAEGSEFCIQSAEVSNPMQCHQNRQGHQQHNGNR